MIIIVPGRFIFTWPNYYPKTLFRNKPSLLEDCKPAFQKTASLVCQKTSKTGLPEDCKPNLAEDCNTIQPENLKPSVPENCTLGLPEDSNSSL